MNVWCSEDDNWVCPLASACTSAHTNVHTYTCVSKKYEKLWMKVNREKNLKIRWTLVNSAPVLCLQKAPEMLAHAVPSDLCSGGGAQPLPCPLCSHFCCCPAVASTQGLLCSKAPDWVRERKGIGPGAAVHLLLRKPGAHSPRLLSAPPFQL